MDSYKKKLESWYDKTADKYDTWGEREGEYSSATQSQEVKAFNVLLDEISLDKNVKVLDIATGTGIYLIEVLKRFGVGYGVDISKKIISILKLKIKKIGFSGKIKDLRVNDAENLPFLKSFFDFVSCIGMFEYYPFKEVKKFLDEIKRVSKKNSFFIFDFPNSEDKETYKFREKERLVGHEVYIHKKKELIVFLENNGFEVIKTLNAGIEIQFLLRLK